MLRSLHDKWFAAMYSRQCYFTASGINTRVVTPSVGSGFIGGSIPPSPGPPINDKANDNSYQFNRYKKRAFVRCIDLSRPCPQKQEGAFRRLLLYQSVCHLPINSTVIYADIPGSSSHGS